MTNEEAINIIDEYMGVFPMDAQAALDVGISALRAQQEQGWISVKDSLPTDEDEMVLAIVSGKPREGITLDGAYELATYIEREGWLIEAYPEWETPKVTHWMPLPAPPGEDVKSNG